MRSGGDSTNISNFFKKFNEDLKISKIFFKYNVFCVILKILRKTSQVKMFKKNFKKSYLDNFNL